MPYKMIKKYSSNVHLYTFNPNEERLALEIGKRGKLERPSTIGSPKTYEVVACKTNAGFFEFNASVEHYGLLISEGLYYSPPSPTFIDLIYSKDKKMTIKKIKYDTKILSQLQKDSIFACGSSFSLIQNGVINLENCNFFTHYISRAARTAIGQKTNGHIVMCVVDGKNGSLGVTGKQLAQIMLDEGCINAVNFDGGGSSVMIIDNKIVNKPTDGSERAVGSIFVVYKKKSQTTNTYPTLRKGSSGEYVQTLQRKLEGLGYSLGRWGVDGSFGTDTFNAVKAFQKSRKLDDDGICGPKTWAALLG